MAKRNKQLIAAIAVAGTITAITAGLSVEAKAITNAPITQTKKVVVTKDLVEKRIEEVNKATKGNSVDALDKAIKTLERCLKAASNTVSMNSSDVARLTGKANASINAATASRKNVEKREKAIPQPATAPAQAKPVVKPTNTTHQLGGEVTKELLDAKIASVQDDIATGNTKNLAKQIAKLNDYIAEATANKKITPAEAQAAKDAVVKMEKAMPQPAVAPVVKPVNAEKDKIEANIKAAKEEEEAKLNKEVKEKEAAKAKEVEKAKIEENIKAAKEEEEAKLNKEVKEKDAKATKTAEEEMKDAAKAEKDAQEKAEKEEAAAWENAAKPAAKTAEEEMKDAAKAEKDAQEKAEKDASDAWEKAAKNKADEEQAIKDQKDAINAETEAIKKAEDATEAEWNKIVNNEKATEASTQTEETTTDALANEVKNLVKEVKDIINKDTTSTKKANKEEKVATKKIVKTGSAVDTNALVGLGSALSVAGAFLIRKFRK